LHFRIFKCCPCVYFTLYLIVVIMNNKVVLLVGVILLVTGVFFGVLLVQQNTEFREKAATTASMQLATASVSVVEGDEFVVYADMDSGNVSVIGVQIDLNYDSSLLEAVSAAPGSFLNSPQVIGPEINSQTGSLKYLMITSPADARDNRAVRGVVANFTFRAKAAGIATIRFTDDTLIADVNGNEDRLIGSIPLNIVINPRLSSAGREEDNGEVLGESDGKIAQVLSPTASVTITTTPTESPQGGFGDQLGGLENGASLPDELPDSGLSYPTMIGLFASFLLLGISLYFAL
jgi:hypothetical protein